MPLRRWDGYKENYKLFTGYDKLTNKELLLSRHSFIMHIASGIFWIELLEIHYVNIKIINCNEIALIFIEDYVPRLEIYSTCIYSWENAGR